MGAPTIAGGRSYCLKPEESKGELGELAKSGKTSEDGTLVGFLSLTKADCSWPQVLCTAAESADACCEEDEDIESEVTPLCSRETRVQKEYRQDDSP